MPNSSPSFKSRRPLLPSPQAVRTAQMHLADAHEVLQHGFRVAGMVSEMLHDLEVWVDPVDLLNACVLHDIGKRDPSVLAATRCTPCEPHCDPRLMEIINPHAERGAAMLNGDTSPVVKELVAGHHPKRSGIPMREVRREQQMLIAADVYDALREPTRSYKSPMPHGRAMAVLVDLGLEVDILRWFSQRGVEVWERWWGLHPTAGTQLSLVGMSPDWIGLPESAPAKAA